MARKRYQVEVVIQNKRYLNDPEGDTIHKDLILKGGYAGVKSVRTAKLLTLVIVGTSEENAKNTIKQMCEELRIFNPIVSDCHITVIGKK